MSGASAMQKQSLADLGLAFLDNEYSCEVFKTLLAVPHFSTPFPVNFANTFLPSRQTTSRGRPLMVLVETSRTIIGLK